MDMSATAGLTFKAGIDNVPILPLRGGAAAKAKPTTTTAKSATSAVARRATPSVNGCVDVSVGLNVEAGLTGSLPIPGLSASQTFPLLSTSAPLFKVNLFLLVFSVVLMIVRMTEMRWYRS